jgi:hypothetical protein
LPRIEEDGGSWLRMPKLYKMVAEPHKKKRNAKRIEERSGTRDDEPCAHKKKKTLLIKKWTITPNHA